MSSGALVTLDITGIAGWKDLLTGIQRVVLDLVPLLCDRIWARGAIVQLVRSTAGQSHHVWTGREPVPAARMREILHGVARLDASAPAAPATAEPLVAQLKRALAQVPSLRAALNRSGLYRRVAHEVERRWSRPPSPPPPAPPPCDYFLGLTGALMHVEVPAHLPRNRVVVFVNDIIPIKHRDIVPDFLYDFFVRESCSLAHRPGFRYVTASSAATKDWRGFLRAHGDLESSVQTVWYGYDRATFYPDPDPSWRRNLGIPDDAFTILSVSTIGGRRKRFPDLAEAVRLCGQQAPIHAVFVGDREGAKIIDSPEVHYPGYVDDAALRRAYSSCDVYVNWSMSEGFGLPLIEALACGARAVVAPDCEALLEVGGAHVSVPAAATPAALADTLLGLYRSRPPGSVPDLSPFDWQLTADRLTAILFEEAEPPRKNGKSAHHRDASPVSGSADSRT